MQYRIHQWEMLTFSPFIMLKGFLSLFWQSACPLCERPTPHWLCSYCLAQLKEQKIPQPDRLWQGPLPRFIWGNYEGKLKQAIAALKFTHHPQIGAELGYLLAEAWLGSSRHRALPKLRVIPIPLHPHKLKERGFNQAELIAQGFCRLTGYPCYPQGLVRVKNTTPLFTLTPQQRRATLQNALQVGAHLVPQGPPILLIDDIVTTGTTAQEAKGVLQKQGQKLLGIAAIATPLCFKKEAATIGSAAI